MSTKAPAELETMRCWQSHSGPDGVALRGDTTRADDPRVKSAAHYWVPDSTLPSEEPSPWAATVERDDALEAEREAERQAAHERAARSNKVKIDAPPLARLTRDLVSWNGGREALILKGSVLPADDERVRMAPDAWVALNA